MNPRLAYAEFYGAMDGASRFTQRDAVASILITGINIIAGFLVGVFQHGMELDRALTTYTVLTIGDGLVTVIPALMISISGGLIVTHAGSESKLGHEFQKQVLNNPQPLMMAAGVASVLAMFPGLPAIPFLRLAGGLAAIARRLWPWRNGPRIRQPGGLEPGPAPARHAPGVAREKSGSDCRRAAYPSARSRSIFGGE